MPQKIPRLTIEELLDLMKDPMNKCLEQDDCNNPLCIGYSTVVLCPDYHSIKSDMEKRDFYKKHGLTYIEPERKKKR